MSGRSGKEERDTNPSLIRLQKVLASAGIGSRRHCEEYIVEGRVTIDGKLVRELGTRVDPAKQKIHLDGELVRIEPKRYFLLNKPPGYVCTNNDPSGRPRAIDLVPQDGPRLFTVGRLDENSCGLLLVTNDGELANRLAHPRYGFEKRYQVQVVGKPTRETLGKLKEGMYFADGKFSVKGIKQLKTKGQSTFLELVLTEGQNREIRRLLARVGHKVIHLQRVGFGPLKLSRLGEGKYRPLKTTELKLLRLLIDKTPEKKTTSGKRKAPSAKKVSPGARKKSVGKRPAKPAGKRTPKRGGNAGRKRSPRK